MKRHHMNWIAVYLMMFCSPTQAVNLGLFGQAYDIEEIDMRVVVMEKLNKVDWAEKQNQLKEDVEDYPSQLTQYHLPPTDVTRTRYVDVGYTLDRDVYAPQKKPDGTYHTTLLYRKGTYVNPLEHVEPLTNMLFVSGRSEEQLAFAVEAMRLKPDNLYVVLTSGNPQKLAKKYQTHFYYLNDELLKKFQLRHTPAMVSPGSGANRYRLAVTEYALPEEARIILDTWRGIPSE